jgi:glyoxylase-like metal-dependent hydrolase (beta-lactamase superfamily II)
MNGTRFLAPAGVSRSDIDHVIMTHLHFDHVGGLTEYGDDGMSLKSVFSKAVHWVSRSNYEFALDPGPRERASYRDENWAPWVSSGQMRLVDLREDEEPQPLLPDLWVERSDGHTLGQLLVHLRSGGSDGNVVFCADLLPTQHHLKDTWGMGFDLQPRVVIEEKKRLLERAARFSWGLVLEHDPTTGLIGVEMSSGGASRSGHFHVRPHGIHLEKP